MDRCEQVGFGSKSRLRYNVPVVRRLSVSETAIIRSYSSDDPHVSEVGLGLCFGQRRTIPCPFALGASELADTLSPHISGR